VNTAALSPSKRVNGLDWEINGEFRDQILAQPSLKQIHQHFRKMLNFFCMKRWMLKVPKNKQSQVLKSLFSQCP